MSLKTHFGAQKILSEMGSWSIQPPIYLFVGKVVYIEIFAICSCLFLHGTLIILDAFVLSCLYLTSSQELLPHLHVDYEKNNIFQGLCVLKMVCLHNDITMSILRFKIVCVSVCANNSFIHIMDFVYFHAFFVYILCNCKHNQFG